MLILDKNEISEILTFSFPVRIAHPSHSLFYSVPSMACDVPVENEPQVPDKYAAFKEIVEVDGKQMTKCTLCGSWYSRMSTFENHMASNHPDVLRPAAEARLEF